MRGRKSSLKIVLSEENRRELEHVVRSTSVRAGVARRARIVLELAAGARLVEIAERTGVTEQVVRHWGRRYIKQGLDGLYDLPRTGRPPVFSPRGRDACGQDCLPASRHSRALALAVGLC
jgi:plasmid stabilization system protein ParE